MDCEQARIDQDHPNFPGESFHFHFNCYIHFYFQAILAVQTNCSTVDEVHKSYGITQSFLDEVLI